MAGSFGFEAGDKYEVSVKAGERVLLPRVREAGPETLIVADGFSCRTQIEQGTGRRALHLAEVLAMALHPEGLTDLAEVMTRRTGPWVATAGIVAAVAAVVWFATRRARRA